ncbi:MAG: hypothetical protein KDD73_00675 [Anaerolineales bacterium]|nr:hypothetical protein [Anaerolineales bacterium]
MTFKEPYPLSDGQLLDLFLSPIRSCATYQPAFGRSKQGVSLSDFRTLYGGDPFYSWLGLDDPMLYAAHKAAGGLTSLYRQIGVGAERLFRHILRVMFELSDGQMLWQYQYTKPNGKLAAHTLDALIRCDDLHEEARHRLSQWIIAAQSPLSVTGATAAVDGVVFEVRQGYKSADSKRQNADLRFGMRAYQAGLIPTFVILSTQVNQSVIHRYRTDGMVVLTGVLSDDPTQSTFAFLEQVAGYDLAEFFQRNHEPLQTQIREIIALLLTP